MNARHLDEYEVGWTMQHRVFQRNLPKHQHRSLVELEHRDDQATYQGNLLFLSLGGALDCRCLKSGRHCLRLAPIRRETPATRCRSVLFRQMQLRTMLCDAAPSESAVVHS